MAIKAQALTNFVVEFTYDVVPKPEENQPEVETLEGQNPDEDLAKWKLFVDRSSNQHGCGARLILQTPSGEHMKYAIHIGFKAINNEAKYETLLAGLRIAIELGMDSLDAFSDSQLVVNQVQGDYLTKDTQMVAYLDEVKTISEKIKDFRICQIPREENKKADDLANLTSAFDFIYIAIRRGRLHRQTRDHHHEGSLFIRLLLHHDSYNCGLLSTW
ncbi:Ribonuclease [Actinidia chinensis var. chinensis]|uniref:Ribonuclease n=1 Tax=Actinidia chinensis var. chinensis TaxID=1590841 RepID=A0A2R6P5Z5_ACTCC|nr:Ribonuclease [Actinidia chinensis var. chinensis]